MSPVGCMAAFRGSVSVRRARPPGWRPRPSCDHRCHVLSSVQNSDAYLFRERERERERERRGRERGRGREREGEGEGGREGGSRTFVGGLKCWETRRRGERAGRSVSRVVPRQEGRHAWGWPSPPGSIPIVPTILIPQRMSRVHQITIITITASPTVHTASHGQPHGQPRGAEPGIRIHSQRGLRQL